MEKENEIQAQIEALQLAAKVAKSMMGKSKARLDAVLHDYLTLGIGAGDALLNARSAFEIASLEHQQTCSRIEQLEAELRALPDVK